MIEEFSTISRQSEALIKEKGSKFFAYAIPVNTVKDVEDQLDRMKKEHHSARHWCYAYRLGESGDRSRSNDDGEPTHSAGDPILRQIESKGLTQVLVVVVRYFGGVKLGVGGLIQAYGGAAQEALDQAHVVIKVISERIRLTFGYEDMSMVMRMVKRYKGEIIHTDHRESCLLDIDIERASLTDFLTAMKELHRVNTKVIAK
ncbi:MAG: YigZ family protein [Flavobacteriales bacterium]|nr:YigZ family protein [Flavobacteriales bacterium]